VRAPEDIGARTLASTDVTIAGQPDAVAFDGPTLLIGRGNHAVQVYERNLRTGALELAQTLTSPDAGVYFGGSVAVSGDWLAVGATGYTNGSLAHAGAVYLYHRDPGADCGGPWCSVGSPLTYPEANALFGYSLSLQGDQLLVGARGAGGDGRAQVFDRDPTGTACGGEPFCLSATLVPTQSSSWFGWSVSIDGDRAAVGAYSEGAAYVYDRQGDGTWTGQRVVGTGADAGSGFGVVALEGDTLAVGSPLCGNHGAVFLFGPGGCGSDWCPIDRVDDPDSAGGDAFGFQVDLDQGTVFASADGAGSQHQGKAYALEPVQGTWQPIGTFQAETPTADAYYGRSVAMAHQEVAVGSAGGVTVHTFEPKGPGAFVDYGTDVDAVDDTLNDRPSPAISTGIHSGFGDVIGDTSRLLVDSGECGQIVFGFDLGPADWNDAIVVYLDVGPGGFSNLVSLTDQGDGLRKAISGASGTDEAPLDFSNGFTADYAIALDKDFGGVWRLTADGSFPYLDGALTTLAPWTAGAGTVEVGLDMSQVGLSPGDRFGYLATYISETAYRSNELHGVDADEVTGNPGVASVTLGDGQYLSFQTVSPAFTWAAADTASVDEGAQVDVPVLDNDDDPAGVDTGSVTLVDAPAHGTAEVQSSGAIRYTHDGSETPSDRFTYEVSDNCGGVSDPTPVTITVNPVNDPPVVTLPTDPGTVTEDESASLGPFSVSDVDLGSADMTLALASVNGTITLATTDNLTIESGADGSAAITIRGALADVNAAIASIDFLGDPNFAGTAQIALVASDGSGGLTTETLDLSVAAVNDAPVIDVYRTVTVDEGGTATITDQELSGSDADDDAHALSFHLVTPPEHGTLMLVGTPLVADDTFTLLDLTESNLEYDHDGSQTTTDGFAVTLQDGHGGVSDVANVQIEITPVNAPPAAGDDAYDVDEDGMLTVTAGDGVLANDTDADGDAVTATLGDDVQHGTLDLQSNGSFTYTPAADFNGTDRFTYTASDGTASSDPATVTITVNPVNDAPVAIDDAYEVAHDTELVVPANTGVLANDTDVDGDALTVTVVTEPAHGTLDLSADGALSYDPDAGYAGSDTFTYAAFDATATSPAATVTLTIAEGDTGDTGDTGATDTGDTGDTGARDTGTAGSGCGCNTSPRPGAWVWVLPALALIRRRRRALGAR